MGKSYIHPSNAIITRADTPIHECISLMQKSNVGSVLVVSDDSFQKLVGIFTERDLLKNFVLIQNSNFWKKPIRTIMSHPVRVLMASQLDRAAEIMLKYGFRHLPVVTTDEKLRYRLLGVISMRDLFAKHSVRETKQVRISKTRKPVVGVISSDPFFSKFFEDSLPEDIHADIAHLGIQNIAMATEKLGILVLDLDGIRIEKWSAILKQLNKRAQSVHTIVVFNPVLYNEPTLQVLEKLSASKNFDVFQKPVSISALFAALGTALTK